MCRKVLCYDFFMNSEQMYAAQEAFVSWAVISVLNGRRPAMVKCAGEFDLHGLHYYIFLFRISLFQKDWYYGVAGGYEKDSLEHCGHISSQMQVYDPETCEADCIQMVEQMRSYWMKRGDPQGKMMPQPFFQSFVLLKDTRWERQAFLERLEKDWEIVPESIQPFQREDRVMFMANGCLNAAVFIPVRMKGNAAEKAAERNYLWPEGNAKAGAYRSYLIIRINALNADAQTAAEMMTRLSAAACNDDACGVLVNDVLLSPEYYVSSARSAFARGLFPLMNCLWIGTRHSGSGWSVWTAGMRLFGMHEMEIINDPDTDMHALRRRLLKAAQYAVGGRTLLEDGETILLDGQKYMAVLSEGIYVRDETIRLVEMRRS
ncbi:MAG: DUF4261 domain-containing protein [Erysipelotrichaceae bacterium]|nr:DUF4261 domain-containing protein [Erysipelotrichaceae bacterium]